MKTLSQEIEENKKRRKKRYNRVKLSVKTAAKTYWNVGISIYRLYYSETLLFLLVHLWVDFSCS